MITSGSASRLQELSATMAMMANADAPASPPVVTQAAARPAGTPPAAILSADGLRGPLSGQTWTGYQIGDLLGSGGMGAVYRALQLSVGRLVALKVLQRGLADATHRARFAAEVRAAARIRSPHVATVYDSGECDGQLWLALELVEGGTLADRLRQRVRDGKPFSVEEAIGLALQAARGLADAHQEHLVHRDIKPANLLLGNDGVLRIADFGLVRILDERSLTVSGTVLGTPQYLSPEQGRGRTTDARGDIYSLGVVLYELLTMRLPFAGSTVEELVSQHNFSEPARPSTLMPGVSQAVDAVCLTCLQKDPGKRYPDALALANDLQRITQGLAPVSSIRSGRLSTGADLAVARLAGHRRQWLVAAGLLAAVALVLAGGWWWRDKRQTETAILHDRLLAPVLATAPLPATAEADLARLAELSGETDALVAAGRAKLARIARASATLTAFARQTAPDKAARAAAEAALADLTAAVGPNGHPQLEPWRQRLRETMSNSAMTQVPPDDPSLSPAREAELRRTLAQLDLVDSELNARDNAKFRTALATLQRHSGDADPDVQRWRDVLENWYWLNQTPKAWGMRVRLPANDLATARQRLAVCKARFGGTQAFRVATSRLDELAGPEAPPWAAACGHDDQGPWIDMVIGNVHQRLRWLAPRQGFIGSRPKDQFAKANETLILVRLGEGIWIADSECTQGLWSAVTGSAPAAASDPREPIVQVSRVDAERFCERLGELLAGCHARLPSEIEWELAARVGSRGSDTIFGGSGPWGGIAPEHINCASSGPAPAGSRLANQIGLHDMLGNVWEWCRNDYSQRDKTSQALPEDPRGVVRGGSWADSLDTCRAATRNPIDPTSRSPTIGFRFAIQP